MELEYKGGNCVVISYKKDVFVSDPKISDLGLKDQGQHATAQLLTQSRFSTVHDESTVILDGPGEYEVHGCSIQGVAAQAHLHESKAPKATTIYRLETEDAAIVILGHIYPELSEEQLEALGTVDILIIPVGGNGYTLDAKGAVDMIRAIEPKIVIPTHYAEADVNYEVPQAELEEFLKELGSEAEAIPKLKLKNAQLPEALTVYQLIRTK
jgi:L-ascorbate metabolism protein UlaG (beta-lactamase superfamily)